MRIICLFLLFTLITAPMPTNAQQTLAAPIYATLGPEAPPILRVLVGDSHVVPVQIGELADLLRQRHIDALIVPQDWADDTDLDAARAAGLRIVPLERENTVTAMLNNISTLGNFTGTASAADAWISTIQQGLIQIFRRVSGAAKPRVLVLTPEAYTQGKGALITVLIGIAGGINSAADAGIPEALQMQDPQIRDLAPDVVLLIGWSPEAGAAFDADPVYQGISAFDQHRVYRIAPPGRDPARLVSDVQALADLFHPPMF